MKLRDFLITLIQKKRTIKIIIQKLLKAFKNEGRNLNVLQIVEFINLFSKDSKNTEKNDNSMMIPCNKCFLCCHIQHKVTEHFAY